MKLLVRNERSFPHACLFFLLNLFMYLFILAKSGLHCCAQAFFSCSEQLGLLSSCIVVASLVAEHRIWGTWASEVAALNPRAQAQ